MKLSVNFINDINGDLIQLEPIVGICKHVGGDGQAYYPYFDRTSDFIFSQKTHTIAIDYHKEIYSTSTQEQAYLTTIPILEKISNLKTSIDYESKKLKISRVRITFSNIVNLNKKYTDKPEVIEYRSGTQFDISNTQWIGKDIYVWFKSPSTDRIQIDPDFITPTEFNDKAMPLFYRGRITRFEHSDKQIRIQAEDKTQMIMGDRLIPKYTVSDVASAHPDIYSGLREQDIEENVSIPLVYGRVGKAVTLPSFEEITESEFGAKYIHDWHKVGQIYPTSNLPFDVYTDWELKKRNWLYIKSGKHWLISDMGITQQTVYPEDYESFPRSIISGQIQGEDNLLIPEFAEDPIRYITLAYQNRLAKSVISDKESNARITDIVDAAADDTFDGWQDSQHFNSHGGYPQRWYYKDDPIFQSILDTGYSYQGYKNYNQICIENGPTSSEEKEWGGSWIFFELEEGCDEEMFSDHASYGDNEWNFYEDTIIGARIMANAKYKCFPIGYTQMITASGLADLFQDEDWYNDLVNTGIGMYEFWQKQGLWASFVKPDVWRELVRETLGPAGFNSTSDVGRLLFNKTNLDDIPQGFLDPTENLWSKWGILPVNVSFSGTDINTITSFWGLPVNSEFDGTNSWWENYNNLMNGWEEGETPKDFKYGCIWQSQPIKTTFQQNLGDIALAQDEISFKDIAVKQTVKIPDLKDRDVSASLVGRVDQGFTSNTMLLWEGLEAETLEDIFNQWLNDLIGSVTTEDVMLGTITSWWVVDPQYGWQVLSDELKTLDNHIELFMDSGPKYFLETQGVSNEDADIYKYWMGGVVTYPNEVGDDELELIQAFDSTIAMAWNGVFPGIWKGGQAGQTFMLENGLMLKGGIDNYSVTSDAMSFKEIFLTMRNSDNYGILPEVPLWNDWEFFRQVIFPISLLSKMVFAYGYVAQHTSPSFLPGISSETHAWVPDDIYSNVENPFNSSETLSGVSIWNWFEYMANANLTDWENYDTSGYALGLDHFTPDPPSSGSYWYSGEAFNEWQTLHETFRELLYYNLILYMYNGIMEESAWDTYKSVASSNFHMFKYIWTGPFSGASGTWTHSTIEQKLNDLPQFLEMMLHQYYNMYYLYNPMLGSGDNDPENFNNAGSYIWNKLEPVIGQWLASINSNNLAASIKITWLDKYMGYDTSYQETSTGSGIIEKPSDIAMHIMAAEMDYGVLPNGNQLIDGKVDINPHAFDYNSVKATREAHDDWKMGFSLSKKEKGRELVEDLMQETKSYPLFLPTGKFGFVTIKERYIQDDITHVVDRQDVIKYKFTKSKIEDVYTNVSINFRHDPSTNTYGWRTNKIYVDDLLTEYNGYNTYGIERETSYKEINSKYHVDVETATNYAEYFLKNHCNVHNIIEIDLPLKWLKIQIGDVLHVPLIDGLSFGKDYSKMQQSAGQYIYPLWIVMEQIITTDVVKIKAYQIHYLGTGDNHGWIELDGSIPTTVGNIHQLHTDYNWFESERGVDNYNFTMATEDSGFEMPYFCLTDSSGLFTADQIDHLMGISLQISQTEGDNYEITMSLIADGTISQDYYNKATKYNKSGDLVDLSLGINIANVISMSTVYGWNGIV